MTVKTDLSFFDRKTLHVKRSQMETCGIFQLRNRAFVRAFFHVSLRITKAEMLHTIDEEMVLLCVNDINCISSGKQAKSKLNIPSFSVNAMQRRISLITEHIKNQVIDQIKSTGLFALQLDESTGVSSFAVPTAFVHYIYNGEFKNEFLCIVNLPSKTRG